MDLEISNRFAKIENALAEIKGLKPGPVPIDKNPSDKNVQTVIDGVRAQTGDALDRYSLSPVFVRQCLVFRDIPWTIAIFMDCFRKANSDPYAAWFSEGSLANYALSAAMYGTGIPAAPTAQSTSTKDPVLILANAAKGIGAAGNNTLGGSSDTWPAQLEARRVADSALKVMPRPAGWENVADNTLYTLAMTGVAKRDGDRVIEGGELTPLAAAKVIDPTKYVGTFESVAAAGAF